MIRAASDTVSASFATLGANKLRSALTLLGIVIGVISVVAMAATTEGLRRSINADLAQLGTGVFQIQKWPIGFGGGNRRRAFYERRKNFTLADVSLLQQQCRECLRVAGEAWGPPQTLINDDGASANETIIAGGTTEFFTNNGYALAQGRFFTDGETEGGGDLVVIGSDVSEALFAHTDPIGQTVRIQGHPYRVVGTLERRGSSLGFSIDKIVILPIATFLPRWGERQSLNITIQARDPARIMRAEDEVVTLMRKARGVPPEAENDFELFSNDSMQETFEEITGTIRLASIGICAIALLIGGIGVMNIMLVAVTERTSEIGVRRALGARRRRILAQFIVEAVVLTSAGGAIGIGLGWALAELIRIMVSIPTVVPAWAVLLSMASAGGVGLVFGIYPAWRASRLDPVEAMRHE